jgi:anti-sigma factor RsiW
MTCSDFLARYSEFLDGETPPDERVAFRRHLEGCESCQRYDRVVTRGVSLLRNLPPQRLRDDFKDRLQHSLYSMEEGERLRRHRPHGASGGGAMAVVAAAALVVAVIWTPALLETTPSVELPAIVVEAPRTARTTRLQPGPVYDLTAPRSSLVVNEADFWTEANTLLFEYSTLYHRHRTAPGLVRTGLD